MNNLLLFGENSSRLFFKKILISDLNAWLPFYQDPRSTEHWNGLPKDPVLACNKQFDLIFKRYESNLGGMNALIEKSSNKLIGIAGLLLQTVDERQELEIGYSILPAYWRNGFATEAARKCKTFAIENKLTNSLISIIHINNIPSQKVALNNGMVLDKTTNYKNNPVHIFRIEI